MHSHTNGNAVPWEARPLPLSQNGLLVLHVDTVSVICNGNISDHVRHSRGYCYMKCTFQSKIYNKHSRCYFFLSNVIVVTESVNYCLLGLLKPE